MVKKTDDISSVPMDCCSVPGVLLCLAVFLAAKGLSEAQLSKCVKVVKKLESLVLISTRFDLIPSVPGSCISISKNMLELWSIKEFCTDNGISWNRCLSVSRTVKQFRDLQTASNRFYSPKQLPLKNILYEHT